LTGAGNNKQSDSPTDCREESVAGMIVIGMVVSFAL
jgi:hypothetical protein